MQAVNLDIESRTIEGPGSIRSGLLVAGLTGTCMVAVGKIIMLDRAFIHIIRKFCPDIAWALRQEWPISEKNNFTMPEVSDEIFNSDAVQLAIEASAAKLGGEKKGEALTVNGRRVAKICARGILNDMVGYINPRYIRFLGWSLLKAWNSIFSKGINVTGLDKIKSQIHSHTKSGGCVVYVPTHKSHIDYLLMSHVLFTNKLKVPFIAAGENLRLPIVGTLLRSSGAFFIRRKFGMRKFWPKEVKGEEAMAAEKQIYETILKQYIFSVLSRGQSLEFFIEGGRSRSGHVKSPKYGVLKTIVDAVAKGVTNDVLLVPVAIDYERVVESNQIVSFAAGVKKKKGESLCQTIWCSLKAMLMEAGRVDVNFGQPLSVKAAINAITNPECQRPKTAPQLRAVVGELGNAVYERMRELVQITSVCAVGYEMLKAKPSERIHIEELIERVQVLLESPLLADSKTKFSPGLHEDVRGSVLRAVSLLHSQSALEGSADLFQQQPAPTSQLRRSSSRCAMRGGADSWVAIGSSTLAQHFLRYYAAPLLALASPEEGRD
jgi:glycerol-3-phosphate O-acyltransferase